MGNKNSLSLQGTDYEEIDECFLTFSSIQIYEQSEKLFQEFKFQASDVDEQIVDQLWPTLGGWNIDDLYCEVLHAVTHPREFRNSQPETATLISHLQQVFHIDNDRHAFLLESAKEMRSPSLVLDLEVAAHEYKHVLHLMLVNELSGEDVVPHQWEGHFDNQSEFILTALELQRELTRTDVDFAQWIVYTKVHSAFPLNAKLFPFLLQVLIEHVQNLFLGDHELKKFWFATEKLVESFLTFFRNLHQCILASTTVKSQVHSMLKTLQVLKTFLSLKPAKKSIKKIKKFVKKEDSAVSVGVNKKTEDAIVRGASEFFSQISRYDDPLPSEEDEVKYMISVAHLLTDDLNKSLDIYHSLFKRLLCINYFDIIYRIYDEKFCQIVEPLITKLCGTLKLTDMKNCADGSCQEKYASSGTSLFNLYLAVKKFADLSSKLSGGDKKELYIAGTFHNWFHSAVGQWLDIAWFKAKNQIRKAVELDMLNKTEDNYVQFTSSALDTANIFHKIRISWNELCWPEVEGSYSFVAMFIDDLCQCTIFYADLMCKKVEELERDDQKNNISNELCLAINNIERVAEEMGPVTENLGITLIIEQLAARIDPYAAAKCKKTLVTVMENANTNVHAKVNDILEKVGLKMRPVIQKYLLEWSETDMEKHGTENLIKYLDGSLITFKKMLKTTTFDNALAILWENVFVALNYLITTYVQKRRPPRFFKQVHMIVQILIDFFYPNGPGKVDNSLYNSSIQEIEELIKVYEPTTAELMLRYYQHRYENQTEMNSKLSTVASLTIRADYCQDTQMLRIEVMNARNLKPLHDVKWKCDPYVKIKLVPKLMFPTLTGPPLKTMTKKKTLFPTFDEEFYVKLSPDALSSGGYVMFTLKDNIKYGRNDILGECFLPTESIQLTESSQEIQDLPQKYLPATLPMETNSFVLQTLERRHWDKLAAKFVKKERSKMGSTPPSPNS